MSDLAVLEYVIISILKVRQLYTSAELVFLRDHCLQASACQSSKVQIDACIPALAGSESKHQRCSWDPDAELACVHLLV